MVSISVCPGSRSDHVLIFRSGPKKIAATGVEAVHGIKFSGTQVIYIRVKALLVTTSQKPPGNKLKATL